EYFDALDEDAEQTDYRWSLGFRVGEGGKLGDVVPDSPAARAGLAPGAKLIAVEGRTFSETQLKDALAATRPSTADSTKGPRGHDAVEVIAASGDFVRTYHIAYTGGPRYPVLKRRSGTPDLLPAITKPLVARPKHKS